MSDDQSYELLGFDNVLLPVGDLGDAVRFYERAGFVVGFRFDEGGIGLLKGGGETPGAGVGARDRPGAGIPLRAEPFSVSTGWTVEIADPWGNVLGFTDYS